MHRSLFILALTALLAACAQPEAQMTPPPAAVVAASPVPAPTPAPEPTIEEVDPTNTPAPTPAPNGDCPASFAALDPIDRAMFGNLTLIQDTFIDRRFVIWDNQYRLNDIPMLLIRRDRAGVTPGYGFLVNRPDRAGLVNVDTFELPTYFDLGTVYCVSPLPDTYGLDTKPYLPWLPLGTNRSAPTRLEQIDDFALALIYGDRTREPRAADRVADPRAVERWASEAVRVGFRRWQIVEGRLSAQFLSRGANTSLLGAPPTAEQLALALLEQRVLAAALRSAAPDEQLLRQFVAVRQLRLDRYPDPTRDELAIEKEDGTAEYVAYRFALASGFAQLQAWPERLLARYAGDSPPEPDVDPMAIRRYLREERPALVGAALGVLLDALAIPWRGQMAKGQTPFLVLESAYRVLDAERDTLLQQAKASFGYDELLARAEAARR
ncbi:MAG TPA: hypothetical protein VFU22_16350 [Roseiflexaceae bacterium]|nr:hypothetical protein [Roseiflexaceae bacterium]